MVTSSVSDSKVASRGRPATNSFMLRFKAKLKADRIVEGFQHNSEAFSIRNDIFFRQTKKFVRGGERSISRGLESFSLEHTNTSVVHLLSATT